MFQGRKRTTAICRLLLSAVAGLALTGAGLVLVPGAGAKVTHTHAGGNPNDTGTDGHDNGGGNDCTNEGKGNAGHPDGAVGAGEDKNCGDGGTTGPTGSTGPTGTTGATGTTGSDDSNGSNDSTNAPGTSGVIGSNGVTITVASSGVEQIKSTSSSSKGAACTSRRRFVIHIRYPRGQHVVAANINVNGKRVATMKGKRISSTITLVGLARGTFRVRISATTNKGRVLHGVRTYHTCVPRRGHTIPKL